MTLKAGRVCMGSPKTGVCGDTEEKEGGLSRGAGVGMSNTHLVEGVK